MAIMQKVQGSKKSKSSSSSSGGGGGNSNSGGGGADPVSSSTTKETVTKASGGSTSTKKKTGPKTGHSRSYPRGVGLDFRKLAGLTLVSYIDHHGVKVRPEAPPSELAVAVARHFEQMEVDEEDVIGGFLERLEEGPTVATEYSRKTQRYPIKTVSSAADSSSKKAAAAAAKKAAKAGGGSTGKDGSKSGGSGDPNSYKSNLANNDSSVMSTLPSASASTRIVNRKRTKWAARPGEQVAAKVTRTDENGSWILASVQRFYVDTETYDVQDEDDTSKLIRLPWSHVMRLSTGAEGCFVKSADCMAIFPETTSFYKSKVAKSPVWKLDHGVPCVKEIVVQFEDDEDTLTGKTPRRRVPSRYVIPTPSAYFYDEHEDVDLISPTLSNRTTTSSNSTTPTPSSTTVATSATAGAATTTTVVPSTSTNSATVTSSTTVKK